MLISQPLFPARCYFLPTKSETKKNEEILKLQADAWFDN